ncbi:MAG: hypothetical protein AB7U82_35885 [Blastocatellales bacterium]
MPTGKDLINNTQPAGDDWEEIKRRLSEEGQNFIPIPYAFTIGAVTIAGILELRDPIENSTTAGAFAGIVFGTYNLSKQAADASANNGVVRVDVRIDFSSTKIQARYCNRRWNGSWRCSDWETIVDF